MDTLEYRTKDKSQWGAGPWQNEPDKRQWVDSATGLPCLITRPHGALCGYVGVSIGHPSFGAHYDAVDVDVHGGLTFAGACQDGPESSAICHKPSEGEADEVWWLGFDCNHTWDLDPERAQRLRARGCAPMPDEIYRDINYVTREVTKLAAQLAAMKDHWSYGKHDSIAGRPDGWR